MWVPFAAVCALFCDGTRLKCVVLEFRYFAQNSPTILCKRWTRCTVAKFAGKFAESFVPYCRQHDCRESNLFASKWAIGMLPLNSLREKLPRRAKRGLESRWPVHCECISRSTFAEVRFSFDMNLTRTLHDSKQIRKMTSVALVAIAKNEKLYTEDFIQ